MIYNAIKYWRDRGCTVFDMVGIRDYKRKFGSHEEYYTRLIFTKYKFLLKCRDFAAKTYYKMGAVKGKLLRKS